MPRACSGQPGDTSTAPVPTDVLSLPPDAVDADLGLIVEALRQQNLYESTLIIVTPRRIPINPLKINNPPFAALRAGLTAPTARNGRQDGLERRQ